MGPPPRRKPPPWLRRSNAQPRRRMLDMRREQHFRYDLREALNDHAVPLEQVNAISATIFSKGSRVSTDEAKAFVRQKVEEGVIPPEVRDRVLGLVERYSTWR